MGSLSETEKKKTCVQRCVDGKASARNCISVWCLCKRNSLSVWCLCKRLAGEKKKNGTLLHRFPACGFSGASNVTLKSVCTGGIESAIQQKDWHVNTKSPASNSHSCKSASLSVDKNSARRHHRESDLKKTNSACRCRTGANSSSRSCLPSKLRTP